MATNSGNVKISCGLRSTLSSGPCGGDCATPEIGSNRIASRKATVFKAVLNFLIVPGRTDARRFRGARPDWWAGLDSNQRTALSGPGLQPGAFNHSTTYPRGRPPTVRAASKLVLPAGRGLQHFRLEYAR